MERGIIPWRRYALLVDLIDKVNGQKFCNGRTALQKFIYFLQELFQMDCGYDFRFYTYGPFASEILSDLDTLESCRGIHAKFVGGYDYTLDEGSEQFKSREKEFLQDNESAMNQMLEVFGKKSAKDLELYATIIWVDRSLKAKEKERNENTIASLVNDLKPKFDRSEIDEKVGWLKDQEYVLQ